MTSPLLSFGICAHLLYSLDFIHSRSLKKLAEFKRAFETLRKKVGVEDLRFHDFRHAFVSRGILAGIPQAMILKASGHSSEEWKRYLNVTPDQLRRLLEPVGEQTAAEVTEYARSVMKGLGEAMRYDEIEKLFEL